MIRRFGFVVLVMALIVSACGRQVTPDRFPGQASGLNPGFMSVKFRVQQQFNFSQYSYLIVFNTSGDGVTPRANGIQTNWRGYSFALIVGGTGGSSQVTAYQYYRPPGSPGYQQPQLIRLQPTQQQLVYTANSNGQNTEFTIMFDRTIFFGINTPGPSASGSATPSPSASPSPSPTGSASPTPMPTISGQLATIWQFNFFTASGALYTPIDSLGIGGPNDTSYNSAALDTTQVFDTGAFFPQSHIAPPSDPSATIAGGDIANNP
jgi:hypothetical protein